MEFPKRQTGNKTGCWYKEKGMEGNPQSIAKWDFGEKKPREMLKLFVCCGIGMCVCVCTRAYTLKNTQLSSFLELTRAL